ncbi:MAG TPA: aminotransferase class V-fold PLP-dependent enzyme [Gemmatimonadaceae bacterium]
MPDADPLAAYAADFGPFDGRAWLNAAHQGPLPRVAVEAGRRALAEKSAPHRISDEAFLDVPRRLRRAIARLIGATPDDVVLGDSASYGLALLARGIPWRAGDEVLFVRGEFPASVFPWRVLERRGVALRFLGARAGNAPDADEVAAHITSRTRVFCTSWVNSFTGHATDVDAIARVCRAAGVIFVLNASQGLGARVLDVSASEVDALVCCGYKWLLGPYGTGFCWLRPTLREQLEPPHAYWLPNVWGRGDDMATYTMRDDLGARAFDIFDTANFLNFVPWTAALEYLLAAGPATVAGHDDALVQRLVGSIAREHYELVSPERGPSRSSLVVIRPVHGAGAAAIHAALSAAGVDAAVRQGAIRFAPHLYNTAADIDRAVDVLRRLASGGGAARE